MKYLNDIIQPGIGRITNVDLYLAENIEDFLVNKDTLPKPTRLKMATPYVWRRPSFRNFMLNSCIILFHDIDLKKLDLEMEIKKQQKELNPSGDSFVNSMIVAACYYAKGLTPEEMIFTLSDDSGMFNVSFDKSSYILCEDVEVPCTQVQNRKYGGVLMGYDISGKRKGSSGFFKLYTNPPVKGKRVREEKLSLEGLTLAGGFT